MIAGPMPKSTRPARPEANALRHDRSPDGHRLMDRILNVPHLAQVVPRLQPEVLHRIVQTCGLEACGELVSLATPAQLMRVFDLDLWRSGQPGLDEALDGDRFGVWLEVLLESGVAVAAEKLVGLDVDLVIAALAQHMLVMDGAAVTPYETMDGDQLTPGRRPTGGPGHEIGGYAIEVKRADSWDAIAALLRFLEAEHHDYFNRLMHGCRQLSSSAPEEDAFHDLLTDPEQDMLDLAIEREDRRDRQGYVTPAQARAFLQMARHVPLADATPPPRNPVADAYFRGIEWTAPVEDDAPGVPDPAAFAAVVDVLVDAGVISQQPRALLDGPQTDAPRLARIQALMQSAGDGDPAAYATRSEELAYLANTLVAGCAIQGRAFTVREAADATAAICNLGLENWPARWLDGTACAPEAFLVRHDLISVFQVGWTVLHADVCMYAADRLIRVLSGLRHHDDEIQAGLDALRADLHKHWQNGEPWRARDALEVIMLLDMPAWAALVGLIDEYPVIHAAIEASRDSRARTVGATAFEFIAENRQIASVHDFMDSLPPTLGD